LRIGRETVDLRRITCPILNIIGRSDDLVPAAQSLSFNDVVGSPDRKTILFSSGHIGLAVGGKAQAQLWPEACRWLAERSFED
jgi:polyhydroxyalkanoate synthase